MKNRIYFDLDGVLRDLSTEVFGKQPSKWNAKREGNSLFEIIAAKPEILVTAKPTEYLHWITQNFGHVPILSNQLTAWIEITEKWLDIHLTGKCLWSLHITGHPEEKITLLDRYDAYIVEDYPMFTDYSRVILVDRPYNRGVKEPLYRVHSPYELEYAINDLERRIK